MTGVQTCALPILVSQSNLFPLHLCWLKRQSVTSFYPFFVCFHFLVRHRHGVFRQFRPIWLIRLKSVQIGPSLNCVDASRGKKKHVAGRGPTHRQRRPSHIAAYDAGAAPLAPRSCFPSFRTLLYNVFSNVSSPSNYQNLTF